MKNLSGYTLRKCDNCNSEYQADNRNLNRGWGLCCSKACAARKREKSKPGYDETKVHVNNIRRAHWGHVNKDYGNGRDQMGNYEGIGATFEFDEMDGHF